MKNALLILLFFVIIIFITFTNQDSKTDCLSGGVCKEGLQIKDNITGELFVVSKDTCIKYNGRWREKRKDCIF